MFFCLHIIMHVGWCRIKSEEKLQVKPILFIAFFCLVSYLVFLKKFSGSSIFIYETTFNFWKVPLMITSSIVFLLLIPFYILFYICTEIESPSMKILLLVKQYGEIFYQDLRNNFTDQTLIIPRLQDLISSGYISFDGRYYRILPKGTTLVRILDIYQRRLGWRMGG